jgi:Fe-Mn family superoxide dismutase
MSFQLPDLPYDYTALTPFGMSEETLKIHHDLHHKAYVDNGNKAIAGTKWEDAGLEDIVIGTYQKDAVAQSGIFNNASQHWNHTLFWEIMGPSGKIVPEPLAQAIVKSFSSFDKFREEFVSNGVSQFGSGWVWLVNDVDAGSLRILKTENGVNPLCYGYKTLLGCDVWEHSYYVDFRNKRPAYLENFIDKLVNWDAVAARL